MEIVDFLNCKIEISRKVFIPRVETEFWVKKAIKEIKKEGRKSLEILDIFSGSGCIGIAVLKNCFKILKKVDFVDIDKNAIAQIEINLKRNKIPEEKFRIIKSNLFANLKSEKYDIIFANPPYVAENRIAEVQEEVLKKEPRVSFLAGKDGLLYIEKFLKEAKDYLKKAGVIYLEFDPKQKKFIESILKKNGYSSLEFQKDQFKKYRWLKIN